MCNLCSHLPPSLPPYVMMEEFRTRSLYREPVMDRKSRLWIVAFFIPVIALATGWQLASAQGEKGTQRWEYKESRDKGELAKLGAGTASTGTSMGLASGTMKRTATRPGPAAAPATISPMRENSPMRKKWTRGAGETAVSRLRWTDLTEH